MPETKWQVWVRFNGRTLAQKRGRPMPQSRAMEKVAALQKDPRVAEAFMEEET